MTNRTDRDKKNVTISGKVVRLCVSAYHTRHRKIKPKSGTLKKLGNRLRPVFLAYFAIGIIRSPQMAVHESDREDLMREAVALVRRIELQVPDEKESVICGFRSNGALSVFFGPDPVYQFDPESRLRRAFVDGLLYRTQGTTLAQLKRQRSEDVTELLRRDLCVDELNEFLKTMRIRLQQLLSALETNEVVVLKQVPENQSIVRELIDALGRIANFEAILAPSIKGKR